MKKVWLILPVLLGTIALFLLVVLFMKFSREEKIFQEQIPLNGITYDEDFLKEAEKLPGIQSVTPVALLTVHLSMEEYAMDTELFGVELADFQYQAEQVSATALGRTPVLLIGKEALSAFSDSNGHRISEKRLNQLLEGYQDLILTASFPERPEQTFSCRVAAILKEPADRICFSIDQAKTLAEQYSQPFSIKEILLTVKGETNFRKAKESFSAAEVRE